MGTSSRGGLRMCHMVAGYRRYGGLPKPPHRLSSSDPLTDQLSMASALSIACSGVRSGVIHGLVLHRHVVSIFLGARCTRAVHFTRDSVSAFSCVYPQPSTGTSIVLMLFAPALVTWS